MCSRSIPLEPDGVAVTVTATGATCENSTRDQSMTTHMMPKERDVCRRSSGCEFSAREVLSVVATTNRFPRPGPGIFIGRGIRDTPLSRNVRWGVDNVEGSAYGTAY